MDSRVTEFRSSDSVPRTRIEVKTEGGKKILLYNPRDENFPAEVTGLVAKYGRYLPDDVLQEVLNKVVAEIPVRPLPPRSVALGFSQEIKPSLDRGLQRETAASATPLAGFRTLAPKLTADQAEFVRSLNGQTVKGAVVERNSPTSILIYNGTSGEVIAGKTSIVKVAFASFIGKVSLGS